MAAAECYSDQSENTEDGELAHVGGTGSTVDDRSRYVEILNVLEV